MADVSRPDHLPNRRAGRQPPHPSWLLRQRRGTTPQMIGRYPDYDVVDALGTWDEATKRVVLARLEPPGLPRFFTAGEESALRAFCDTILAQDREPRVPVAEMVDSKLADGRLDGYQYADMPDDRDTWRLVLRGLDHTATQGYRTSFAGCTQTQREAIVSQFAQDRLVGGAWDELNVARAWTGGDASCAGRVLLPPMGLDRDRLRRPGLPARVHAARRTGLGRPGRCCGGAGTVRETRCHR
jgi:hypothetical protein